MHVQALPGQCIRTGENTSTAAAARPPGRLPTAPVLEDDLVGTGASDPSAEAVNSVALSFSEQGLLQPLLALHIPDRNQILNTVHASEFNPEDIRFKNAAQLDELLSSMHTEVGLLAHTLSYNACPTYD